MHAAAAAAAAKSLQSCPTLWDPIDGIPPGSPVPGILQARTLEWAAIAFSNQYMYTYSQFTVVQHCKATISQQKINDKRKRTTATRQQIAFA